MKRLAYISLAILLLVVLTWYAAHNRRTQPTGQPPTTMDQFKQVPGANATVQAGEFLLTLAKEGNLPGIAQGEHGTMHAGIVDANANTPSGPEPYPISRVIHFSKQGDDSDYFYAVVIESNGAPCQLQRAWRTNPQGQVVESYPVP